ncbi:hypothetical protein KX729_32215 [Rhizobium sp. XQZ8]|uniref:hypothetical protein n=1 Tax=Rhizobium populisoli TaxID=2859785 RepID=UPI001CA5C863|nr:hypothetical protein [Rhizobium populisoli]MBW6426042.1 hypothetical protein [Rhizobium populisoli]
MHGIRRRTLRHGVLICIIVIISYNSFSEVRRTAQYGGLLRSAAKVESGEAVDRITVQKLAESTEVLVRTRECRGDIIKAALTILLLNLDNENSRTDYDGWSASLLRADKFVVQALSCQPTNGNFWLRLAMTRQSIAEQPEELRLFLELSQKYAPAEERVTEGRFLLYSKVGDLTLSRLNDLILADLRTICRASAREGLKALVESVMGRLTVDSFVKPECKMLTP